MKLKNFRNLKPLNLEVTKDAESNNISYFSKIS